LPLPSVPFQNYAENNQPKQISTYQTDERILEIATSSPWETTVACLPLAQSSLCANATAFRHAGLQIAWETKSAKVAYFRRFHAEYGRQRNSGTGMPRMHQCRKPHRQYGIKKGPKGIDAVSRSALYTVRW
jgi:hypothetical protein